MRSETVDGSRCRSARERSGLTQDELAKKISGIYDRGCRPATIAHIERGSRQPSGGLFRAMCQALEVDRRDLLVTAGSEAA